MKNSKKSHDIVGQNDNNMTKSQKHDVNLQKNSTLYFQVGLILTLLATYALFEMQFQTKQIVVSTVGIEDEPQLAYAFTVEEKIKTIEKKVEPVKKRQIITPPEIVPDDVSLNDGLELFDVELPKTDAPVDPSSIKVPDVPEKNVTYSIIGVEQVPIYPGCEGLTTNKERLDCMSNELGKLVTKKFNSDVLDDLNVTGLQRIYVNFKIDKTGQIVDIKARNPNPILQKEAIKVAKKIPQMIPGKQSNKNVEVIYTLPIVVKVLD